MHTREPTWLTFSAIMLTAITLSATFAHLMELPTKMAYEPELYVRLHRTLYSYFGWIGGPAEILAIAVTALLAWRLRHDRSAFPLTATAALLLAVGLGAFMWIVLPTNLSMRQWPLDAIPGDWTRLRNRWEYTHAVRALLVLLALSALVVAAIRRRVSATAAADTAASRPV